MRVPSVVAAFATVCFMAGCSTSSSSSGGSETKPTYAQAEAVAKRLLPANHCRFQVKDDSSDSSEKKSLECFTTVGGQPKEYGIFDYTRKLKQTEADKFFGGVTTASRYFQNGNITVDPSTATEAGEPALDAPGFAAAVKQACSCGDVKTPTQ